MYCYEFEKFSCTVDIIVINPQPSVEEDKILLVKRKNEPYKNYLSLPGGFIEINESVLDAAKRELKEETNLDIQKDEIMYLRYIDNINRDPRCRTISFLHDVYIMDDQAKLAVAGDDASDLFWIPIQDIIDNKIALAFDHQEILNEYFESYGLSPTN